MIISLKLVSLRSLISSLIRSLIHHSVGFYTSCIDSNQFLQFAIYQSEISHQELEKSRYIFRWQRERNSDHLLESLRCNFLQRRKLFLLNKILQTVFENEIDALENSLRSKYFNMDDVNNHSTESNQYKIRELEAYKI